MSRKNKIISEVALIFLVAGGLSFGFSEKFAEIRVKTEKIVKKQKQSPTLKSKEYYLQKKANARGLHRISFGDAEDEKKRLSEYLKHLDNSESEDLSQSQ